MICAVGKNGEGKAWEISSRAMSCFEANNRRPMFCVGTNMYNNDSIYPLNILNILNAHVWEHWNLESTRNGCQC